MVKVESGSGNGREAKVGTDNRLFTQAVSETESAHALDLGNAYNLNTGIVSISATTGMMYMKNNEDKSFLIEAIAVGMGAGSYNTTGMVQVQITRNPTTGTLIESTPSNVDQNANRNFGSSNTLTADVYKAGASGDTITNGDDIILIGMANAQSRLYASIGIELQKGNSVGIEINPNLSSGSTDCYVAIVGHLITST